METKTTNDVPVRPALDMIAAQDARIRELEGALAECVAWMDAPHRVTPLQTAILTHARRILEGGKP